MGQRPDRRDALDRGRAASAVGRELQRAVRLWRGCELHARLHQGHRRAHLVRDQPTSRGAVRRRALRLSGALRRRPAAGPDESPQPGFVERADRDERLLRPHLPDGCRERVRRTAGLAAEQAELCDVCPALRVHSLPLPARRVPPHLLGLLRRADRRLPGPSDVRWQSVVLPTGARAATVDELAVASKRVHGRTLRDRGNRVGVLRVLWHPDHRAARRSPP